jgi:hypothetical protein
MILTNHNVNILHIVLGKDVSKVGATYQQTEQAPGNGETNAILTT